MMPSKFKYRKDLAKLLQKHGLEITDIMLAELDVWEHTLEGLTQEDSKMKVARSNTMTAERMLGYAHAEDTAFIAFRICKRDYYHYRNYPMLVYADDKVLRVASYLDGANI